jgi:hypothetical protein
LKCTHLHSTVQRVASDIGLKHNYYATLGNGWYKLCEAWIAAEYALGFLGGASLPLQNRQVAIPTPLVAWSHFRQARETTQPDFSSIGADMVEWWRKILPSGPPSDVNVLIGTEWCRAGLTGIALFMVGMKEWGLMLKKDEEHQWGKIIEELSALFNAIPHATDL